MQDVQRQLPLERKSTSSRFDVTKILNIDLPIMLIVLMLTVYGSVVLYSASGKDVDLLFRQFKFYLLGYVVMVFSANIPINWYARWSPLLYSVGVLLLFAVFFFGDGAKGAQRWLKIGDFRFQPSELIKLVLPMFVGLYLSKQILPPRLPNLVLCLLVILVPTILILLQPDLGTSILVFSSSAFVLFMAGIGWWYVSGAFVSLALGSIPLWLYVLKDYQKQRILTLLDPESDKLGAGWNIIQSKTAIGSGGWSGKGWLAGTQSQLDFLPESQTDFIIAVLAEEFGLRGVLILLILYLFLILRGLWIAFHAESSFGRLLAGGIAMTFFIYVFVNMGMVAGLLPVVGVPLPLFSVGGTSVVTLLFSIGILMAVGGDKRVFGK